MTVPIADAPIPSLRRRASEALARAWQRAIAEGSLPATPEGVELPAAVVERPSDPAHGDLASSLPLKLARPYRRPPISVAEALAAALREDAAADPASPVGSVAVAAPGFVTLRLSDAAIAATLSGLLERPDAWGRVEAASPEHVNVEFVSANPTGPLHIGNARGAFVGDLLGRVLEAAGRKVTREYYFNDFGAQVRNLGGSVLAVRGGTEIPPDGYHGDYVVALASEVPPDVLEASNVEGADAAWQLGVWASERVRAGIEASLERLGVHFDVWKSEGSLHREGWIDRAVERLREGGHVYEQDGALWFRSTAYGDDKDRVVVKSNGERTYFAADIGYVAEKFSRGFDRLVYIWGADHHGTVARVRNAAEALGFDKSRVEMLLTGWVRFVRDGQEVSMSKRAGLFITLDELLEEVGVDAARWTFASRGANLDIDFDIELAKRQSSENPVYYVQYAHARIASILRKAADAGIRPSRDLEPVLEGTPEATLARAVVRLPEVVEDAAAGEETQGVTTYATELATTFHAFYRDARVVDAAEPERSGRRLALVDAARVSLARSLELLGISAPEAM